MLIIPRCVVQSTKSCIRSNVSLSIPTTFYRHFHSSKPSVSSSSPSTTATTLLNNDDLVLVKKDLDSEGKSTGVTIISLNNPKNLNALTETMGEKFKQVIKEVIDDISGTRCVVLTGEGKAFSAGGDLDFLLERGRSTPHSNALVMRDFYDRFLNIRKLNVPIVSCINGHAIGAGLCLALATDLRIANKNAKLGVNFASLGIHPGMGCTHFLPQLLGNQLAAKMILTGELISGSDAAQLGLVLQAVESDEVLPASLALARKISSQSAIAVQTSVRTLRTTQEYGLEAALRREADAQSICYNQDDLKEGIAAIREKRTPVFWKEQ